jgi:hypothetical protein
MYRNISKYKPHMTFLFNALFLYIFLIGVIFLLITLIFNLYFTDIIYCDSSSEIIADTINPNSEYEGVFQKDETSIKVGLEISPSLWFRYKLIIRRKLYWYFSGSNSNEYTNYEEFKRAWKPEMSLRIKLKDELKIAINNPRADFSQFRNKAHKDLENSIQKDVRWSESLRQVKIAKDLKDLDRLNRGLRK